MERGKENMDRVIVCKDCITGETRTFAMNGNAAALVTKTESGDGSLPLTAPGLIDLQVNGISGVDFNREGLTCEDVVQATNYLLSRGITTYLPTVITNSDENILQIMRTIGQACAANALVGECIWGIHLEGPFLSPVEGARGAHDQAWIKPPDWELFQRFHHASGGRIKLITLAPEWDGSRTFIEKCRAEGIIVSIGHSMANAEQISSAVEAGASLSTHLGNGVPLSLPRHPNILWEQLARDELHACIITDGIHLPDPFIRVVMKTKERSTLLVSDATCFAGMPPGEYKNHIGGTVILDREKRISLKSTPGLLAGAAKSLLENVEYLVSSGLATIGAAWQMASVNVAGLLAKHDNTFSPGDDWVIFEIMGNEIAIIHVIKNGRIVFNRQAEADARPELPGRR